MYILNSQDQTIKEFSENELSDFFNSISKKDYKHFYFAKTKEEAIKLIKSLIIIKEHEDEL
tara:strand:+ start:603 stop:785 length:183 start_codon:yes stop_codon:yes gene_type:complete